MAERRVQIKQISGNMTTLTVDADMPIAAFKSRVSEATGVPTSEMRLIYKAKQLLDSTKLSDYVTEDDQAIHLVKNAAPQAQPQQPQANPYSGAQQRPQFNPAAMFAGLGGAQGGPNPLQNLFQGGGGGAGGNPFAAMQQMMQGRDGRPFNPMEMLNNLGIQMGPPRQAAQEPRPQPQPQAQPSAQARPQVQQPQPQAQAQPAAGSSVIKLPHQTLFEIGQQCNRLMGEDSTFPGPPMPQLPFDRNPMVLLGSYLSNLAFNMQRMAPYMQRCGDLLQRESLMTDPEHRQQTAEMAVAIGIMLEELAKASGSVAHLYKKIEIGPSPGNVRIYAEDYNPMFKTIIENTGAVNPAASQIQETSQMPHQAPQEESKEEDYDELLLEELADEFSIMEMMQLMKGNLAGVKDPRVRIQKVIRKYLRNETDTKDNRAHLSKRALVVLRREIQIPEELNEKILDECDPNSLLDDLMTEDFPKTLDMVLDAKGDDASFVEALKTHAAATCHRWVFELSDVFEGGVQDVIVFLKRTFQALLSASVEPQKKMIVINMGLPMIMKFVEASYKDIQAEKLAKQEEDTPMTQVITQEAEVAKPDVEMKPAAEEVKAAADNHLSLSAALQKCQTVDERREMLMKKYNQTLQASQQLIASRMQRPHSRAYKALDLNGQGTINEEEEKIRMGEHFVTKSQKVVAKPELVKTKIYDALHNAGRYKASVIDSEMSAIDAETGIPEALRQAYFDLLKAGVKTRLAQDSDYQRIKGSGRTPFLDQL